MGALFGRSDEAVLLGILGVSLVVGAFADSIGVSAAVAAFLIGLTLSGEPAERATRLLNPLRDLFAAAFFLFFGLQVDPGALGPVIWAAAALAAVTAATKVATGTAAKAGSEFPTSTAIEMETWMSPSVTAASTPRKVTA